MRQIYPVLILLSKILLVILAGFTLSDSSFAASDDIPFYWEGEINITKIIHDKHGDVTTTWNLKPKWKETDRIDVKDEKGYLVGQLVKLDDCGSSWFSELSGIVHIDHSNGYTEDVYSGSAGASGAVITSGWGWIYYTLSDNDPLKELLPNGCYFLSAASTGTEPSYEGVITRTEVIFVAPETRISTRMWPVSLSFKINGAYYYEPFGGPASNPMPVEGIKYCITSPAQAQMPRAWDTETRVITDETMSGSCQTNWPTGNITNKISWDIAKRLDINVILEKADEFWRPKAEDDAEPVKITARIEEYKDLKGKWVFTLYDVSKEKGYCMNAGDSEDFDLEFDEGQAGFGIPEKTEDGWIIETTETMNEASVMIQPLDYGAWGRLKAEVFVEGQKYEAEAEGGGESITIPLDKDEDHIADKWESDWGVSDESADADNDYMPEELTAEKGDGFSNYEEYRGFMAGGKWDEMIPYHKDIFICDKIGRGVGYFTTLGLRIQEIEEDEFDSDHVVNFNRGWGKLKKPQKGVLIRRGVPSGTNTKGYVSEGETVGGPGTPNDIEEVIINVGVCSDYDVTVTHELGHAVGLYHHGDSDHDGIARRGGLWSGDIMCVMRYDPPHQYCGRDGNLYPYPDCEGSGSLTQFCDQQTGTEINAPGERDVDGKPYPVAADATKGECKKKVKLKGY